MEERQIRNNYGEKSIGILLFETGGQKLLGDPGFVGTFSFPVSYGFIKGSYRDLIKGSPEIKAQIIKKAQELVDCGSVAIAGDCGLMSIYQSQVADEVKVPFVASSLILIPFIRRIIAQSLAIGVITGHSQLLGERHLKAAGISKDINLVFQGMEDEKHFNQVVIQGKAVPDYELMKESVFSGVEKLLSKQPSIGGILLECSNLASFSHEVFKEFKIPVFDINLAINVLKQAVSAESFFRKETVIMEKTKES